MKVVIELIGNESKQDLLATSNYLRELAGEAVPKQRNVKPIWTSWRTQL